jgi:hypothetical protein
MNWAPCLKCRARSRTASQYSFELVEDALLAAASAVELSVQVAPLSFGLERGD